MNLNLNINFGCTPEFKQTIETLVDGLSLRRAAGAFRDILEAAEQVPNTAPDEPAQPEEPKAERKTRRRKAAEEPAPAPVVEETPTPEASVEAPVVEEPSLVVDAPVAEEPVVEAPVAEEPVPPMMGLKEWKQLLADTRNRLGLEDGQENFAHKREFNSLVRKIASVYGAERPAELTPANLYYCATQVAGIEWDGKEFTAPAPGITPAEIELNKQAPF